MARFSKSNMQRSGQRMLALLGVAGAAATAVPAQAAPMPERLTLEARVAQARLLLRGAAQAPAGAEVRADTMLAQANNWNNWPNWSNWANWANG